MALSPTGFGVSPNVPATGPIVLYPRAVVAVKYIYNDGSEVNTTLLPSRASVVIRPHHQCGTCEVEFNGAAVPFDLRRLNGIFLSVFMGAADSMHGDIQSQKYLQFVGYADNESVKRSPDGTHVTIAARDLSALLRDLKPMYVNFPPSGTTVAAASSAAAASIATLSPFASVAASAVSQITGPLNPTPKYTDTMIDATNRILKWAGLDKGQFEISDLSNRASTSLTSLVSSKGSSGYIPIKARDVSAWEAIEHTAAIANVIVNVDLGKIVFRNPKDVFPLPDDQAGVPPKYSFIFGKADSQYVNAYEVDITKKFLHSRKGVRLVAVDPVTRDTITADYPPDAGVAPKHAPKMSATKQTHPRKVTQRVGGGVTNGSQLPDAPRDVIAVGGEGVHSQQGLELLAERYYRERSSQELEGTLTTYVWDDKLFALRNADRFEIKVKPELETELINQPDEAAQVAFLRRHFMVNDQAAHTMLSQIRGQESSLFYARSIRHDWSTSEAKTTIDFISLVVV